MNEKGEVTIFCVLILVALSGLLTLTGLELQRSFRLLQNRTELFLCVKETKGEFNNYMKFMGRTNWLLKNTSRAQLVMFLIPGLQGAAMNADRLKRVVKHIQNATLVVYTKKMIDLKNKGCPLDPQMLLTPFELSLKGYKRGIDDTAILRKKEWTYYFLKKPYLLTLKINAQGFERIHPEIKYKAMEKGAMLSSLLSSR